MASNPVLFSQLIAILPMLFVYIAGLTMTIIWWKRLRGGALLALFGLIILALTLFRNPLIQIIAVNFGGPAVSQQIMLLSALFSIFRAIGSGLLIGAIFAGRQTQPSTGFDISAQAPMAQYASANTR